ncbi:lytic transglycosylase domain-containing protein [Brevibacillus sp. MS2.2]|uniref:lytic transglycosylase domain-containing protein n=1 Tax=Brevibacillus sp. MS2.2 TaxID=2738981 RepID=UPI00156B5F63|nr:transglycosylase SLT domain-containing protein [Brevibacillus sp. MS2.2]NRR22130.1 transglycosylase SLT domain-containing protein [Brevibacillus sp. MS2.2]
MIGRHAREGLFKAMKVPVSLQPYLQTLPQTYDASSLSYGDEGLFSDILQSQLATNGQRVISSQEILAKLDGSRNWKIPAHIQNEQSLSFAKGPSVPTPEILDKIDETAKAIGVDADLVREVVRAESNFNPNVESHAGAKGLMQLMDNTAKAMQVRNVYDPDENLEGGTKYLKSLLDRYDGDVKVALAAYNAGPGRMSRLGISSDDELEAKFDQLPQETQRYVDKIMSRLGSEGASY